MTLIAFLNTKNDAIHEMSVFPSMDRTRRFHVTAENPWMKRGERLEGLSQLIQAIDNVSRKR